MFEIIGIIVVGIIGYLAVGYLLVPFSFLMDVISKRPQYEDNIPPYVVGWPVMFTLAILGLYFLGWTEFTNYNPRKES